MNACTAYDWIHLFLILLVVIWVLVSLCLFLVVHGGNRKASDDRG